MSKMRLGMHEEKWDIWNGTQAWGSSTSRDTTQHTGMESSTRHDTTQHTGMGASTSVTQHSTRTWSQAQGMTQHAIHGVKHKA